MPTRNAHINGRNQEQPSAPRFDINDAKGLKKFVNAFSAIAMTRESDQVGERKNALDVSVAFLKAHGLRWIDIIEGWAKTRRGDTDTDTAAAQATITHLLTRIAGLEAEVHQLRAECDTNNQIAMWTDAAIKPSEHARVARWALDLHARMPVGVGISKWEVEFLEHMTRWAGRQTPKQEERFRDIIGGVVRRSKQTPPTS